MSRWLWSIGSTLVMLGLAAMLFGWDGLLWIPAAILEAIGSDPETYGVIALGVLLMILASLMGRRSG